MDLLLTLWIAALGLTRVNLLGDTADFLLNPFLVLSPIIIGLGLVGALGRGGAVRLPRGLTGFVLLAGALLAVVLVSAFLSYDLATSARRTLLLCVQITAVTLIGIIIANRPDPRRILLSGAWLGLAVSVIFNFLQIGYWFLGDWLPGVLASVVSIEPGNYAGVVPRLTAASHDPNHGGILVVIYCYLVWMFGRPGRWRTAILWAGGISIAATLSRSVILAALVMIVVTWYRRAGLVVTPRVALGAAGFMAAACTLLLVFPATMGFLEAAWDVLSARFTLGEGSSREHASVLARGWEVGTRDLKRMFFGVGYGNAFTELQDIFPGNKYGNFHSLFVTLFAESGVLAVVLGAVLFVHPIMLGGLYQPMVAGLLVFNLFQQSQTEPISWFILLLAWTGVGLVPAAEFRDEPPGSRTGADWDSRGERLETGRGTA